MTAARGGRRRAWLTAFIVVAFDQLTKVWAQWALSPGLTRPFLPGLLRLRLVFNTGAAFSLFTGATAVLGVVSLVVAVGLAFWIQSQPLARPWQWLGSGALLGGAIGNGLDRWRLGSVVDFLELVPVQFPVFNLADVAINVALACLVLDVIVGRGGAER